MSTTPPAVATEWATALVVVNYGSHQLLQRNFAAFSATDRPRWLSVVVVDNFSTADERDRVRQLCAVNDWILVAPDGNAGFGRGVDLGIAHAADRQDAAVVLINPDAVIDLATIEALRNEAIACPSALVAPRVLDPAGHDYFCGAQLDLTSGRTRGMRRAPDGTLQRRISGPAHDWVSGACVAFATGLVNLVGGMGHAEDDYFLYWEDIDFSHRVLAAGGRVVVRQDLVVVHDEGGTQHRKDPRAKSSTYYYWNTRNRLVFAARNLDPHAVRRWIRKTPSESWAILMRGGRRQLLHSPGLTLAALRGSVAGVVVARQIARKRRNEQPRRMLIAHPGAELYGSDRVMIETATALAEAGVDVTVTVPGPGPLVTELEARGVTVALCPAPVLRKNALRPRGAVVLLRETVKGVGRSVGLVRRAGKDGVHVSTITIPLWLVLARTLRRPLSCHVHEAETGVPAWMQRLLTAPVLLAPTVLVNSRFSSSILAAAWPSLGRRAIVIDNPVPGPPQGASPPTTSLGSAARLLFIGRLSPRKGPQVAVDMAAKLVGDGVPVTLTLLGSEFAGYEWFVDELHTAVTRAGLVGAVTFAGFANDVWKYFEDADIVLVPSQADEPFGNTAVEAVLAARPVVASAQGGLVEAISGYDSAQGVAAGDVGAWVAAVRRIVGDWSDYAETAAADAHRAARRHDPARYRDSIRRELLGQAEGGR